LRFLKSIGWWYGFSFRLLVVLNLFHSNIYIKTNKEKSHEKKMDESEKDKLTPSSPHKKKSIG